MGQESDVVQGLRSLFARGGIDLTDDQLGELAPEIERHGRLADLLRARVLVSDEPAALFTPELRHAANRAGAGDTCLATIRVALAHIPYFAPNRPDLPLSASVPLSSRAARAV